MQGKKILDKLIIKGQNLLNGEVEISGSKNASLPILFATLLTDKDIILNNVPNLRDVTLSIKLLEYIGKKIEYLNNNKILIRQLSNIKYDAPYDLVRQMRASVLIIGPMFARYKKALVSLPGGCAIGIRPINLHLEGLKELGADIDLVNGYVSVFCKNFLSNKIIKLKYPSVEATENLIMSSIFIEGKTVIENVAKEPEIIDLCNFLNKMGAIIKGIGTSKIEIFGVKKENLKSIEYTIIPDRIEAGTFIILGALASESLVIKNFEAGHIEKFLEKVEATETKIEKLSKNILKVYGNKNIKPVSIETSPYPGFPTDMQAQWMVFMTQAEGKSIIKENIFENRFMHVAEMMRLGANLEIKNNTVLVNGKTELKGANVMATDLRASAALVLAGLVASGKTEISRIYHLDRGYEAIEKKMTKINAKIFRVKE